MKKFPGFSTYDSWQRRICQNRRAWLLGRAAPGEGRAWEHLVLEGASFVCFTSPEEMFIINIVRGLSSQ